MNMDLRKLLLPISLSLLLKCTSAVFSNFQTSYPESGITTSTGYKIDENCVCYPPNDFTNSVPQGLYPKEIGIKRLVVYFYMGYNPDDVKMYIPGPKKQRLMPELPLEDGDDIVSAGDVPIHDILFQSSKVIEIIKLSHNSNEFIDDRLPRYHPIDKDFSNGHLGYSETTKPGLPTYFPSTFNNKENFRPNNGIFDFAINYPHNIVDDSQIKSKYASYYSNGDSNRPDRLPYPMFSAYNPNGMSLKPSFPSKYPSEVDKALGSGKVPGYNDDELILEPKYPSYHPNGDGPMTKFMHKIDSTGFILENPNFAHIANKPANILSTDFLANMDTHMLVPNVPLEINHDMPEIMRPDDDFHEPSDFQSVTSSDLSTTIVPSDETSVTAVEFPTSLEVGNQNVPIDKFDEWLSVQLKMFFNRDTTTIDTKTLKNLIEKTLSKSGMHMNKDELQNSDGKKLNINNLKLRPLLIRQLVETSNIWNNKQNDNGNFQLPKNLPYLEGILITLVYPPKILGIIPLGLSYLPKNLPSENSDLDEKYLSDNNNHIASITIDSPHSQQPQLMPVDQSMSLKHSPVKSTYISSDMQGAPKSKTAYLQRQHINLIGKPQIKMTYTPEEPDRQETSNSTYENPHMEISNLPGTHYDEKAPEIAYEKPKMEIAYLPEARYDQGTPKITYDKAQMRMSQLPGASPNTFLHNSLRSSTSMGSSAMSVTQNLTCGTASCNKTVLPNEKTSYSLKSKSPRKKIGNKITTITADANLLENDLSEQEQEDLKIQSSKFPTTDLDLLTEFIKALKTEAFSFNLKVSNDNFNGDKVEPKSKDKDNDNEISELDEEDHRHGFRIIGGNAATSSGTPVSNKGRSGILF